MIEGMLKPGEAKVVNLGFGVARSGLAKAKAHDKPRHCQIEIIEPSVANEDGNYPAQSVCVTGLENIQALKELVDNLVESHPKFEKDDPDPEIPF